MDGRLQLVELALGQILRHQVYRLFQVLPQVAERLGDRLPELRSFHGCPIRKAFLPALRRPLQQVGFLGKERFSRLENRLVSLARLSSGHHLCHKAVIERQR